ncbi:CHASE2 domain-containing protein [Flammeovirgaceae bacterium SG7u.111]|nr:CHASE2 domain-containing protein [Flammeovirgaceae bacterium SG7u.132]WPO35508.1 CHASE2 domain-containing protein [Flammeovirgaceae bacterium SG7u.111]
MKKFVSWVNVFGTLSLFGFLWVLGEIGIQFDFLNVFEQVISDYNLTDIYYTKVRDNSTVKYDENIVLVNIGGADRGRRSIAAQIAILNKYEPKVIGIDAKFFTLKDEDPIGDFMLAQSIKDAKNFVMGSEFRVLSDTSSTWDTLIVPPVQFAQYAHTAHVNTGNIEFDDFVTWRDIPVKEKTRAGVEEVCFAAKIAELYDKEVAEEFMARGNDIENIYFKGNLDKYQKLDVEDVLDENFTSETIKGKIILMGYLGDGYTDYHFDEDKFYTPLNEKMVGRGVPDMFGVVVHANIVSMILDRTYINEMPIWMGVLIAIIVCHLNVVFFTKILFNKRIAPYYGLTKIVQLVEVLFIVSITILLFGMYNYKLDLTLTFLVIILVGDVTEIYVDIFVHNIQRLKLSNKLKIKLFKPKLNRI